MSTSPEFHLIDLESPQSSWLGRLMRFQDLAHEVSNAEGPQVFARVYQPSDLRELLGYGSDDSLVLVTRYNSDTPHFLAGIPQMELSDDPEAWPDEISKIAATPATHALLFFQNPRWGDGAVLPQNFINTLVQQLKARLPHLKRQVLLGDETFGSFVWDSHEDAARLGRMPLSLLSETEVWVMHAPEALLSGAPPSHYDFFPMPHSKAHIPSGVKLQASPVSWKLLQRDLNQGLEIVRYRHLALRNLKALGDALREALAQKKVFVPLWPMSGLYATLIWPRAQGQELRLLARRFENAGLKVGLSQRSVENGEIRICFIRDNARFQEGLKRLLPLLLET